MNTRCDNQEKLLRYLSSQGDPTAFFTISADYFKNRYLHERKSGVSHQEAQSRIGTEAVGLLEELQRIKPEQFDTWFDEHCMLLPSSAPEVDFEKENAAISADVSACLSHCSRALLTTGSEIARSHIKRHRRFPRNILQHTIAKILLGVVAAGLLFTLVAVFLIRFETSIRVILISPTDSLSFQFPPPAAPRDDSIFFLPAIQQDTVDTAASDMESSDKDTTVTPVAVTKKPLTKPVIVQPKTPPVTKKTKPINPNKEPRVVPVSEPVAAPPPPPPVPPPTSTSETNDIYSKPSQEAGPGNEAVPVKPEPVESTDNEPDLM